MCELMFNRTAIFIELNIGLVRAIEEFLWKYGHDYVGNVNPTSS